MKHWWDNVSQKAIRALHIIVVMQTTKLSLDKSHFWALSCDCVIYIDKHLVISPYFKHI